MFRPSKFSVTMFETRDSHRSFANTSAKSLPPSEIPGYTRLDRIVYELGEYDLVFMAFEKIENVTSEV